MFFFGLSSKLGFLLRFYSVFWKSTMKSESWKNVLLHFDQFYLKKAIWKRWDATMTPQRASTSPPPPFSSFLKYTNFCTKNKQQEQFFLPLSSSTRNAKLSCQQLKKKKHQPNQALHNGYLFLIIESYICMSKNKIRHIHKHQNHQIKMNQQTHHVDENHLIH